MQVEIGKQRRNHRPLRRPLLRLEPLPIFYYSRPHPFQNHADEPFISDPMPHELFQMTMFESRQPPCPYPIPLLRLEPLPIFYPSPPHPFQNHADEPFISDPMPHELFQMTMFDFVEK